MWWKDNRVALFGLTSESKGKVCSLFFLCDLALPSNSQVIFGTGRPLIVAGILIGSPARMHSRSSANMSRLMEGGTVKLMETSVTNVDKPFKDGSYHLLMRRQSLTYAGYLQPEPRWCGDWGRTRRCRWQQWSWSGSVSTRGDLAQ